MGSQQPHVRYSGDRPGPLLTGSSEIVSWRTVRGGSKGGEYVDKEPRGADVSRQESSGCSGGTVWRALMWSTGLWGQQLRVDLASVCWGP